METEQSSSIDMPPPISATTCAFGGYCGGEKSEEKRPIPNTKADLCGWCRNAGFVHLVKTAGDDKTLRSIVQKRWNALESEAKKLERGKDTYACALRDPEYAFDDWRTEFIPRHGIFLCDNPVSEKGELCRRCQTEVRRQLAEDKNALPKLREMLDENKQVGFVCVMRDEHFKNDGDNVGWKRGFHELVGKLTPEQESHWFDKKKHVCCRSNRNFGLCDNCYARMHPDSIRFNIFFDKNATLRPFIGKYTPSDSSRG